MNENIVRPHQGQSGEPLSERIDIYPPPSNQDQGRENTQRPGFHLPSTDHGSISHVQTTGMIISYV